MALIVLLWLSGDTQSAKYPKILTLGKNNKSLHSSDKTIEYNEMYENKKQKHHKNILNNLKKSLPDDSNA